MPPPASVCKTDLAAVTASVAGKAEDIFDAGERVKANAWLWRRVNGRGMGRRGKPLMFDPRVFMLTNGTHFFEFRGREARARLDKLVITNDRQFEPVEP